MKINIFISKGNELYARILDNKLVTVCVLFTIFTLLDTIPILLGFWPAKTGLGPYLHLLGRLVLHLILISGLFIFDSLRKKVKSKLLIYIITFIITWGALLAYIWSSGFFVELHPDAFRDMSISYAFMYFLLGILIFTVDRIKNRYQQ